MAKKIFYIISTTGIIFCVFYIFSYSIGYNLFSTNYYSTVLIRKISPQGWGFFAESPRNDAHISLYEILPDGEVIDIMPVNSHYRNLFGLSKKTRMISYESGLILKRCTSEKWTDFNGRFKVTRPVKMNTNPMHYFKSGTYAIVKKTVSPYVWRNLPKNKIKREIIYVECHNK